MEQIEHPSLLAPQHTGISTTTVLIIILCSLIGIFLFLKLQPYISFLSILIDYARSFLNSGVGLAAGATKNIVDQTADGSNLVVEKVSGKKRFKKEPQPDDATSIVQTKAPYCYVGEWKGVRSCVKVKGKCESDQTFATEARCVNPELR